MASAFTSKKHSPRPDKSYSSAQSDTSWINLRSNTIPTQAEFEDRFETTSHVGTVGGQSRSILKQTEDGYRSQWNGKLHSHNGNKLSWVAAGLSDDDYAQAYGAYERSEVRPTHEETRQARDVHSRISHRKERTTFANGIPEFDDNNCVQDRNGVAEYPSRQRHNTSRITSSDGGISSENHERESDRPAPSVSSSMPRSISPIAQEFDQPVLYTSFIHPLKLSPRRDSWIEQPTKQPSPKKSTKTKNRTRKGFIVANQSSSPSRKSQNHQPLSRSARSEKPLSPKVRECFPSFKISFTSSGKLTCKRIEHPVELGFGNAASSRNSTISANLYRQSLSSRSQHSKPGTIPHDNW